MSTTTIATKTLMIPIRATLLRGRAARTGSLCCLGCGGPLDLSQPDVDRPGRLVGVCHGLCRNCGSAHLINAETTSETLVAMIPSFAALREAIDHDGETV